jgi:hypothetical protein
MEKEFATYEQALALKELGFDEPCLASYETVFGSDIDFELGYIINGPKNYVLSPLKQQVFRWFREKYEIHGEIFVDDNKTFIYLISRFVEQGRLQSPMKGNFNTYEEAENACIDKLIELVK